MACVDLTLVMLTGMILFTCSVGQNVAVAVSDGQEVISMDNNISISEFYRSSQNRTEFPILGQGDDRSFSGAIQSSDLKRGSPNTSIVSGVNQSSDTSSKSTYKGVDVNDTQSVDLTRPTTCENVSFNVTQSPYEVTTSSLSETVSDNKTQTSIYTGVLPTGRPWSNLARTSRYKRVADNDTRSPDLTGALIHKSVVDNNTKSSDLTDTLIYTSVVGKGTKSSNLTDMSVSNSLVYETQSRNLSKASYPTSTNQFNHVTTIKTVCTGMRSSDLTRRSTCTSVLYNDTDSPDPTTSSTHSRPLREAKIRTHYVGDLTDDDIDFIFTWDKKNVPPKVYQQSYCTARCDNGQIRNVANYSFCRYVWCFPCICKRPECQIYGICCPDISEPYMPASELCRVPGGKDTGPNTQNENNSTDKSPQTNSSGSLSYTEHTSALPSNVDSQAARRQSWFADLEDTTPHPKVKCDRDLDIIYIRSCLPGVNVSSEVIRKCEHDVTGDDISFDSYALVTDNETNVVYYNKFCADCNGVKQLRPWNVNITCLHFMLVYQVKSLDELLRRVFDKDSVCESEIKRPEGLQPIACGKDWYSATPVDTCNVTGQWREYDDDVVAGCASLTGLPHVVSIQDCFSDLVDPYKNIFCAICNMRRYPLFSLECWDRKGGGQTQQLFSPYSILFNLQNKSPASGDSGLKVTCNVTEWAGPDGTCIPTDCSPGKDLVDGNCTTAVTQITGLGYNLRLWFLPEVDQTEKAMLKTDTWPPDFVLEKFYMQLSNFVNLSIEGSYLRYGVLINISTFKDFMRTDIGPPAPDYDTAHENHDNNNNNNNNSQSDVEDVSSGDTRQFLATSETSITVHNHKQANYEYELPLLYWLNGRIIAREFMSRDVFEQTVLDNIISSKMLVDFSHGLNVSFKPVVMWQDVDIVNYCREVERRDKDIHCFYGQPSMILGRRTFQFSSVHHLFLNVSKVLTCRYISLQPSQYSVKTTYRGYLPLVTINITLGGVQLTLDSDDDLSQVSVGAGGELNICCDLLDQQIALLPQVREEPGLMGRILYVLTLVCMGVSVVCLLFTVMTYAKFAVLRNVAGRNNLCLCLTLLLAQLSLLATTHLSVTSNLCVPVGILTHFLWLSVFSWNFLCCFNMYKVFSAKTHNPPTTTRSQRWLLIKNLTYSWLTPAIIVVAVVVGTYVTTGGRSLGYGGSVCYLNEAILVGVAMIGPVVGTTISNMAFFLVTVYKIHGVRKLQTFHTFKKDDQHNLYVYFKLSTMTGALWVTFIIAELSDLDGLRIVAIILNGLQGLFIFISYACTKRVLMLYLPSLRPQAAMTTGARSSNISVATATTDVGQQGDHLGLQQAPLSLSG